MLSSPVSAAASSCLQGGDPSRLIAGNAARPSARTPGRAYQAMETRDLMPQLSFDSSFLLSVDTPRVESQTVAAHDYIVLDIQFCPAVPASDTIRLHKMPDRVWTYRATIGGPDAVRVLGYIRWSEDDVFIARTLGSERSAASTRRFKDAVKAALWLWDRSDQEASRAGQEAPLMMPVVAVQVHDLVQEACS
jgi:hypothetical protein